MIDGLLKKLKQTVGNNYKIVATGGYAELICKGIEQKVTIIDPDLTIKGLNILGAENN